MNPTISIRSRARLLFGLLALAYLVAEGLFQQVGAVHSGSELLTAWIKPLVWLPVVVLVGAIPFALLAHWSRTVRNASIAGLRILESPSWWDRASGALIVGWILSLAARVIYAYGIVLLT